MKFYSVLAILAFVTVPVAFAAPNAQVGSQTAGFWSEEATVAVQGGTGFELHGVAGDFDIMFLNANGASVGFFLACGADSGTVPASATSAIIMKWDDLGELAPCAGPSLGLPSAFVYVDGL